MIYDALSCVRCRPNYDRMRAGGAISPSDMDYHVIYPTESCFVCFISPEGTCSVSDAAFYFSEISLVYPRCGDDVDCTRVYPSNQIFSGESRRYVGVGFRIYSVVSVGKDVIVFCVNSIQQYNVST